MQAWPTKPKHRRAALLLGAVLALGGCESADLTAPTAPTGGQEFTLDQAAFAATVAPVLTAKGCDNRSCHGGGLRGSFELSPFDDKDVDFDFVQAARQVNPLRRERSNLLAKPLSPDAGGAVHTAPADPYGFLSRDDPGYQAILAWVNAGELR